MFKWHPKALLALEQHNYDEVVALYEHLTDSEPGDRTHYWYLGLAYLLQGNEDGAQTAWLFILAQAEDEEALQWTDELIHILETEANRLQTQENWRHSALIRYYIKEFSPGRVDNLLELIELELKLDSYTPELLTQLQICESLTEHEADADQQKLLTVLQAVLPYPDERTLEFSEACFLHINPIEPGLKILVRAAMDIGYRLNVPLFSIELIQLCLKLKPGYTSALEHLSRFYLRAGQHQKAIDAAKDFYEQCLSPDLKLFSNSILLKALLEAGAWSEVDSVSARHRDLITSLIQSQSTELSLPVIKSMVVFTGLFFYLKDDIQKNRLLQNQSAQLFYDNLTKNTQKTFPIHQRTFNSTANRPLKIGYVAHTLKGHSVGWLSRWLFKHHNHKNFHISTYLLAQSAEDPFFQTWIAPHIDQIYAFWDDVPAAAEQIYKDEIDILIDLDSTTLDDPVTLLGLKPAPVQATWLGWDASGLPSIDYFIADPYVLSPEADVHYSEKIWRLPQTYIAVGGFEADVPTLRRSDLQIPMDAVVYLSSQVGMKRHPDTIRLQLQIIKEVPNSYFLIKGLSDTQIIQDMFLALAEEIGIQPERLKFLPMTRTEYIHRANLQIADVILDTYPYNGATTTLEALWMGIPLVTRVGEQFAARNSYAFMMNVGVTEGIAHSAEEYVQWGIRLGTDFQLRQDVIWKLKKSRHCSPLWDTKTFTHQMESAYQSMWQRYLDTHSGG